mmetsp:Transcript_20281/g.56410  ORF Transcript_20281/g.56410 Transcript_20281/m.56410 type:complete len:272 (+) Transcript_20281:1274-2089(+)
MLDGPTQCFNLCRAFVLHPLPSERQVRRSPSLQFQARRRVSHPECPGIPAEKTTAFETTKRKVVEGKERRNRRRHRQVKGTEAGYIGRSGIRQRERRQGRPRRKLHQARQISRPRRDQGIRRIRILWNRASQSQTQGFHFCSVQRVRGRSSCGLFLGYQCARGTFPNTEQRKRGQICVCCCVIKDFNDEYGRASHRDSCSGTLFRRRTRLHGVQEHDKDMERQKTIVRAISRSVREQRIVLWSLYRVSPRKYPFGSWHSRRAPIGPRYCGW